ncbi:MAG: hypothetical protein AAGB34_04930 [Planctomycetota bacterium]
MFYISLVINSAYSHWRAGNQDHSSYIETPSAAAYGQKRDWVWEGWRGTGWEKPVRSPLV